MEENAVAGARGDDLAPLSSYRAALGGVLIMASADAVISSDREWPFRNPWPWMISGLALIGLALLWVQVFLGELVPVLLVTVGVVLGGAAIVIRPGSSRVLAWAALAAFLGCWALYSEGESSWPLWHALVGRREAVPVAGQGLGSPWDSMRLFLAVAALVALAASLILLLPRLWRRVVVSALIVLHFGGILCAVLSASPGMWLASMPYTYFYRYYLEFMYLTNAYHFYAPQPGPAYQFWFRIEFTRDGKTTHWHWHKVPGLDENGWPQYPLALQYQRRLALTSLLAQTLRQPDQADFSYKSKLRERANLERFKQGLPPIPRVQGPHVSAIYAEPSVSACRLIESYVRHVAHQFQEGHPEVKILNVKVFRVEHPFLSAGQMAARVDPNTPITYLPYYWGEYDAAGKLLKPHDPFLYWLIPFIQVPENQDPMDFFPDTALVPALREAAKAQKIAEDKWPRAPTEEADQFSLSFTSAVSKANSLPKEDIKFFGYVYLFAGDTRWVQHYGDTEWREE
jgi:hypothetical protein